MTKISLGQFGAFLTGRSLAKQIVETHAAAGKLVAPITLDFQNVEAVTQSFMSELLVQLRASGISLDAVTGETKNTDIAKRLSTEIERLKHLP